MGGDERDWRLQRWWVIRDFAQSYVYNRVYVKTDATSTSRPIREFLPCTIRFNWQLVKRFIGHIASRAMSALRGNGSTTKTVSKHRSNRVCFLHSRLSVLMYQLPCEKALSHQSTCFALLWTHNCFCPGLLWLSGSVFLTSWSINQPRFGYVAGWRWSALVGAGWRFRLGHRWYSAGGAAHWS